VYLTAFASPDGGWKLQFMNKEMHFRDDVLRNTIIYS
jgi:hypothetical protein